MKTGIVLGCLEIGAAARGYEEARWVQLRTEGGTTVALDPIGVRPGQTVIYAEGPAANQYDMQTQTDTVITAVVK